MTYAKSHFPTHQSKTKRIIIFGDKFLKKLEKLLNDNLAVNKIVEHLKIHNNTIIRLAVIHNFNIDYIEDRIQKNERVMEYRTLFNDLLDSSLKITKELIFKKFKEEHEFLRMYDYKYYYEKLRKIPSGNSSN